MRWMEGGVFGFLTSGDLRITFGGDPGVLIAGLILIIVDFLSHETSRQTDELRGTKLKWKST